jgi:hypothetical protein
MSQISNALSKVKYMQLGFAVTEDEKLTHFGGSSIFAYTLCGDDGAEECKIASSLFCLSSLLRSYTLHAVIQ